MKTSITKYAQALTAVLKDETDQESINEKIQNFLKLLVKKKDTKLIKSFMPEFRAVWLESKGQLEVKVTLPYEQSAEESEELAKALSKALEKEVIISVKVDENVIGGMKLEFEDYVIDGTVLKNLQTLKYNLINQ
jgi:F-type H+-transporting ATPase subunit delta